MRTCECATCWPLDSTKWLAKIDLLSQFRSVYVSLNCENMWKPSNLGMISYDIISCRPYNAIHYHLNFLIESIVIFGLNVPKCAATKIVWAILIHDSVPPSFHSRVVCWQFLTHTAQAPDSSPTIKNRGAALVYHESSFTCCQRGKQNPLLINQPMGKGHVWTELQRPKCELSAPRWTDPWP